MPKNFGLIADQPRTTQIGKLYKTASFLISEQLALIDPLKFSERQAATVTNRVNSIVKKLNTEAAKWSHNSVPESYKEAMATTRNILRILGAKKNILFENKAHTQAIDLDESQTILVYLEANASIRRTVETYINLMRYAATSIIQVEAWDLRDEEVIAGLLDDVIREGGSRQDLAGLIRQHFKQNFGEAQFININGRNYQMGKYAKMVARTRLRVVQSDAVKNMSAQYENDLIEISDHGTTSAVCIPFEGNVYSISGNTPGFEVLTEWPPFHPNCEHHAAPTSEAAIFVGGR